MTTDRVCRKAKTARSPAEDGQREWRTFAWQAAAIGLMGWMTLGFVSPVSGDPLPDWTDTGVIEEAEAGGIHVTTGSIDADEDGFARVPFFLSVFRKPDDPESQVEGKYRHKTYHLTLRRRTPDLPPAQAALLDPGEITRIELANESQAFDRPEDLGTRFECVVEECLYFIQWLDNATVRVWQYDHSMTPPPNHQIRNEICEPVACQPHKKIVPWFRIHARMAALGSYWAACRAGLYIGPVNESVNFFWLEPEAEANRVPAYGEWRSSWSGYGDARWPCDPFRFVRDNDNISREPLWGGVRAELAALSATIEVVPKGMQRGGPLPDLVSIGVGAIVSPAHQADVYIQVQPPVAGIRVPVRIAGGRGHGAEDAPPGIPIPHAELKVGNQSVVGGGPAVRIPTGAGGLIQGILTSSDVLGDCTIQILSASGPVSFTWDEFREEDEWAFDTSDLETLSTIWSTVTFRHHRHGDETELPWKPLDGHKLRFFVTEVHFWDGRPSEYNDPPVDNGLSEYASFPLDEYTTDADGRVYDVPLVFFDWTYVSFVVVAAYDWTVWETPITPLAQFMFQMTGVPPLAAATPPSSAHVSRNTRTARADIDVDLNNDNVFDEDDPVERTPSGLLVAVNTPPDVTQRRILKLRKIPVPSTEVSKVELRLDRPEYLRILDISGQERLGPNSSDSYVVPLSELQAADLDYTIEGVRATDLPPDNVLSIRLIWYQSDAVVHSVDRVVVTVLKVEILQPAADRNNTYLAQPDYNSTGPIAFKAKIEGMTYTGNIDWEVKLEYQTDAGGPPEKTYQFTSPDNQAVNRTFTSEGGRLTIKASATVGGVQCSEQIINYITGVGIPNATITTRLRGLYTPPPGGTAGLLTGIAMKESTYRQFFNSYTKYGLTSRWPVENISITPPCGTYIGMMQVPVAMDTAWDWLVNTQTGANIFAQKLTIAANEVAKLQAAHPGLPNLAAMQLENYALGIYGGFYPDRYYTPVQIGGQWQWQTTTRQALLDYVSLIRNNIQ